MAKRDFFEVMKEAITAIAPGLENVGPEVSAELSRLGTQGALEMAQALFNGGALHSLRAGPIHADAGGR